MLNLVSLPSESGVKQRKQSSTIVESQSISCQVARMLQNPSFRAVAFGLCCCRFEAACLKTHSMQPTLMIRKKHRKTDKMQKYNYHLLSTLPLPFIPSLAHTRTVHLSPKPHQRLTL